MRYILYARKSSESEDRQVQSIGDQLRVLRESAEKLELQIVVEMTESRSAKDPGARPIFGEMLKRIERGEADGIFCWSINRLARNPIDSGSLSWLLQKGTLKIIKTIDREYRPEDNVLLMAVESGVATQYVLDLRKAVIRGMEGKASRGWYPCKPPQGYEVNQETKEIVPKEPQFSLLRRAWELLLTNAYTVPEIHRELVRWGYSSAKPGSSAARVFSLSHLYRIFDNTFYCGHFTFRERFCEGKHKAMVTKDEFNRCQKIIHGDTHIQPKRHEFPYTGLMRCGTCGCAVTAERKVKHYKGTDRTVIYEYYRCTRKRGHCPEPCVTSRTVEDSLASKLDKISIHPGFGQWLIKVIDRDLGAQLEPEHAIDSMQKESLKDAERKLARLIDLRVAGEVTAEEFVQARGSYDHEISTHRIEQTQLASRHQAIRNAIQFGISARGQLKTENLKLKRQIAQTFVGRCVLTQGRLEIEPNSVLARIAKLEPPKEWNDMVRAGYSHSQFPIKSAWGKSIRTLVSGLDSFNVEDLTRFTNFKWLIEPEAVE
jgi:DNA invertase Pin-like site-specific DNA recombinase